MKECKKCGVSIHGNNKTCPLCQGRLEGEDEEPSFPVIDTVYKKYKMFFKLLILGTASLGIISVAVNLILKNTGMWSFFVIIGICCFWLSMTIAFKNRNNIPKNILHQVVVVSLMCVLWDCITGWRGWSINYVFPISCAVGILSMEILSHILSLKIQNHKIYMITNIILGLAPFILYLIGTISVSIPSLVCTAISMIFFIFSLLFYGDDIKKELLKKFHL